MVFISNHSEKGKHYFTFFIIISGRYLLVTFYEFIKSKKSSINCHNQSRKEKHPLHMFFPRRDLFPVFRVWVHIRLNEGGKQSDAQDDRHEYWHQIHKLVGGTF